jgi:biopolymer transport protein ExbD
MNFRSGAGGEEEGFQLAPLIDIVFLLLVFFIVTSALQQIERQTDITVPTSERGKVRRASRHPYTINVSKDGEIFIGSREFTIERLRFWLTDLRKAYRDETPAIIIRADRETAFQHFVRVLDACAAADIRNVAYANTEEGRRGG